MSLPIFPFVFAYLLLPASADGTPIVLLTGLTGELRCTSSFAPPWSKSGTQAGDYRIIGLNGKKHPNWNEPRFEFLEDANEYFIKITDVRLKDAGKYICEGDSSTAYLVTVLRYVAKWHCAETICLSSRFWVVLQFWLLDFPMFKLELLVGKKRLCICFFLLRMKKSWTPREASLFVQVA